jgi:hypothetical protein
VRLGAPNRAKRGEAARVADPQLGEQVAPLVFELPAGDDAPADPRRAPDALTVEAISPLSRLGVDDAKVGGDRAHRPARSTKANELWVLRVPACAAAQHRLGEQGLTPQGDQTLGVEVFRMERPQAHRSSRVQGRAGNQPTLEAGLGGRGGGR